MTASTRWTLRNTEMDVEIFLRSLQRTEGETLCQERRMSGRLETGEDGVCLRWREAGGETILRFSGGCAALLRGGEIRCRMDFDPRRRRPADWESPWGALVLETETESVRHNITAAGGMALLRYTLRSGGAIMGQYSLKLNITERNTVHDQHD